MRIPVPLALLLGLMLHSAVECSASTQPPLTVVTYNIRHGRGADDTVNLARTAAVLRDLAPDVVALQEVDDRVTRSGGTDQAAALGGLLGMEHAFGSFFDYQGGQYGMAILSRHPIRLVEPIRLPDGNEPRVALLVEVELPGGERLRVINVHFDWVASDSFRLPQARALAGHLDTLAGPWIVLGDFNDLPGSPTLALFRERAEEAAKPPGAGATYPASAPEREIDYIFAAPRAAWVVGVAEVIPEAVASDHRPVRALLRRRFAGR